VLRHINPDHYLQTDSGRVYTEERNKMAWQRMYADLEQTLRDSAGSVKLYVVMGVQGGGKTTWIQSQLPMLQEAVFLDAALPAKRHRAQALSLARSAGVPAVGVWINVPLELALERNSKRADDERVPEAAVRSVYSMIEPPSVEEGFVEVIEVSEALPRY
jgi:predicted kinase